MLNRRFPKNLAHLSENSLFVRFSRLAFFRHGFRHRSVHFIKRGAGQLDATAVPFSGHDDSSSYGVESARPAAVPIASAATAAADTTTCS
jgi:hypothetical protein